MQVILIFGRQCHGEMTFQGDICILKTYSLQEHTMAACMEYTIKVSIGL